jgi:hypothetical protein
LVEALCYKPEGCGFNSSLDFSIDLNLQFKQGINLNRYQPPTHLSLCQKGSYYMGIRLFNCLPLNLKNLHMEVKRFKTKLKEYLGHHSFYTVDEFIEYSSERTDHI